MGSQSSRRDVCLSALEPLPTIGALRFLERGELALERLVLIGPHNDRTWFAGSFNQELLAPELRLLEELREPGASFADAENV